MQCALSASRTADTDKNPAFPSRVTQQPNLRCEKGSDKEQKRRKKGTNNERKKRGGERERERERERETEVQSNTRATLY